MFRDPVCGMELKESEVAAKTEYQGETYYFCSLGCKEDFDRNPERYLERQPMKTSSSQ